MKGWTPYVVHAEDVVVDTEAEEDHGPFETIHLGMALEDMKGKVENVDRAEIPPGLKTSCPICNKSSSGHPEGRRCRLNKEHSVKCIKPPL